MRKLISIVFMVFFVSGLGIPANATVFFFDDFENPWSGDYAPGWINTAYRHGAPPVGEMMQQTAQSHEGSYGLKLIADSVPEAWMWWAAVEVENLPHYAMKKAHNPYVKVWYYDELGNTKAGQSYAVPDWQVDEDWTDVQFGGRYSVPNNYYFATAGLPHPGWQNTNVARTSGWHELKFQLSSADGYIHFYIDGTEVGQSTRNDYTNLGTAIGLYTMFAPPLSTWEVKPFTLWDDFEVGSDACQQSAFYFGDFELSQWQSQNFPQLWDLKKCDLKLNYTIDLSGQGNAGWTPVQVGLRDINYPNLDPNDHGGWMQTIWQDPDPTVFEPKADLDDHFLLVNHGWASDEMSYDVDENGGIVSPFGIYNSYAFWFDRDGVDQYQATYWNYKDGKTYNTNGIYDVGITYEYNDAANRATMVAKINGESQGFYLDGYSSTNPPSEHPVGKSFTADDLSRMVLFLGRGGGGGIVTISDLTVIGCPILEEGMATGGGWFIPEPDNSSGLTLNGSKATFGFVAKQKSGQSSGQLEFQYKADLLNLKSTSYDWVTVSSTQVIFEGTGTINGSGSYKFRVWAFDGDKTGGVDRFTIRIWTGNDYYEMPTYRAEGNLGGGQIVVHKK